MVYPATKTLEAIEAQISGDQGARFRETLATVLPHMGDAYRGADSGFRSHMGASMLGGDCGRALWYGFRWYTKKKFGGQTLRLFNRGHLEEARFISMLLAIGVQVYQQDEHGNQFRISELGGHLGGSGDGVAIGVPDVPQGTPCLLEFKTSNDANFKKLQKEGMRGAKFEHYVQTNLYMRKMGIPFTLYMVVNKNNDELYAEIIQVDEATADQFLERGRRIIMMQQVPPKINGASAGLMTCRWCDHRPVCHMGVTPETNCRTCKHSEPQEDGTWWCTHPQAGGVLSKETQLQGCAAWQANV